jgi:hypothetical protein
LIKPGAAIRAPGAKLTISPDNANCVPASSGTTAFGRSVGFLGLEQLHPGCQPFFLRNNFMGFFILFHNMRF